MSVVFIGHLMGGEGVCTCVRREGGERWGEEGAEYLVV